MISHEIQIRIRYGETDQMGFAHHSNYLKYFELSRLEWLLALGVSYRELEQKLGVAQRAKNKKRVREDLYTSCADQYRF